MTDLLSEHTGAHRVGEGRANLIRRTSVYKADLDRTEQIFPRRPDANPRARAGLIDIPLTGPTAAERVVAGRAFQPPSDDKPPVPPLPPTPVPPPHTTRHRPPFGEHGIHRRPNPRALVWRSGAWVALFLFVGGVLLSGCDPLAPSPATPDRTFEVPDSGIRPTPNPGQNGPSWITDRGVR